MEANTSKWNLQVALTGLYKKCLITGGNGLLGSNLIPLFDIEVLSPPSRELDITQTGLVNEFFELHPDIDLVIHAAAYTDVKKAEQDFMKCNEINVLGTYNILNQCTRRGIKMIYISTDAVFDGSTGSYSPTDALNPVSKYAKSKTAGELMVRTYDNSLVIRTSFFDKEFPYEKAFTDQWTTKDYIDIMAPKIYSEIKLNKCGVSHVLSLRRTLYELAKIRKPDVLPSKSKEQNYGFDLPTDLSLTRS